MTHDVYSGRNVGAMGPGATANHTIFIDDGSPAQDFDLTALADELGKLTFDMKGLAGNTEQLESLVAVSAAEDAARKGDGAAAMEKLRVAGSWAWDTATKIGVSVAAEAIKKAIGLG